MLRKHASEERENILAKTTEKKVFISEGHRFINKCQELWLDF